MHKSIKTVLLFSTLLLGTFEGPAIINHTDNTAIVAHADTSSSKIDSVSDNSLKQILLNSVNHQFNTNYSNASQITNDNLNQLTQLSYNDNSLPTLQNVDLGQLKDTINFNQIANINFNNVQLTANAFSSVGSMNSLTQINIFNAGLTSTMLSSLNAPNLSSADISQNNITNLSFLNNSDGTNRFPHLIQISSNKNSISDLSPMVGHTMFVGNYFNAGTSDDQNININQVMQTIPKKGDKISIPVNLKDVSAKGPISINGVDNYIATQDNTYLDIIDITNGWTAYGNNGKPSVIISSSNVVNPTNGISSVETTYDGSNLPSSVTFHFGSILNVHNLINAQGFNGTYTINLTWPDKNSSKYNNNSTNSDTTTNDNNVINNHSNNSGKSEKPVYGKVISIHGMNLYKTNRFTKANRIKHFNKSTGYKRPLFKVIREVSSSIDTPRYYVVQIDTRTHKKISGTFGYITAQPKYVTPLYYTSKVKSVKVISKKLTSYDKKNLTNASKVYKKGSVLKIKSIKKRTNSYSLELTNGKFVSANKYFVVKVK